MMLFRFLLNRIKPSNEQLRNKNVGSLLSLKIWFYQLLLRRLLKTYLHYAISDKIIIDGGNIKIVHESRDLEFENELIRNKIEFKSEIVNHSFPLSIRKNKSVRHFHYFKLKDVLSLYVDEKELFVKHDEAYSIDGTIKGNIKCSSKNSCVSQSTIEIMSSRNSIGAVIGTYQDAKSVNNNKTSNLQQRKKIQVQKIFEKEKVISPISTPRKSKTEKTEAIYDKQPKSIEKRGFDIDTSF